MVQHRRQCTRISWLALGLGLSMCVAAARAHDFWIEPETFRPALGARVGLRILVGGDFKGDAALFNPEQFERYVALGPDGEQPVAGNLGDDPAGTIKVTGPGLYTVGYFSKKFDVSFDSFPKFKAYLEQEGLERHLKLAEFRAGAGGKINEIYSRCAKTLIAAPRAETDAAQRRIGCPLELINETNPYQQNDLTLRLVYRDQPLEGALVIAFNKAEPLAKLKARTDRAGRVTFKLPRAGVWLVTSVHMI
ncbi:MAG: DUF4198 domain-containing protein, partial [Betaproteobacteria bacterium]